MTGGRRTTVSSTRSSRPVYRASNRNSQPPRSSGHDHVPLVLQGSEMYRRVWKACERCRQKKTKCDGKSPCRRCKDDGFVCTAGSRKKGEYKHLPRGYAEVLENTQLALIETIHKLYIMVRDGEQWDLAEPELNDNGQPIIHNIVTLLGSIRPNATNGVSPKAAFSEDEAGLWKLAVELEVHQQMDFNTQVQVQSTYGRAQQPRSPELSYSDFEQDYRQSGMISQHVQDFSPQSFDAGNDFTAGTLPHELDPTAVLGVQSSPHPTPCPAWNEEKPTTANGIPQLMQQLDMDMAEKLFSQDLAESGLGSTSRGKIWKVTCSRNEFTDEPLFKADKNPSVLFPRCKSELRERMSDHS